jgi:hypothetical protein
MSTGGGKDELRSLNICFSTTDGLLSRWIRWYTGAPVSHAAITFRSLSLDKVMVMEASGSGFRLLPWRKWAPHNRLAARFRLDVPIGRLRAALQHIADRLGDGYDSRGLFGFVPRFRDKLVATDRGRRPRHNLLDDPSRVFCSEAVAEFLLHAGFDELTDPSAWSPADLYWFACGDPRLLELPLHESDEEAAPDAEPSAPHALR